ncbi:NB-ARC domain-containing protein [Kitasatospora sp. NPDC087314]|uniref:NB-ARC domain-containing protein n=1 Tax=Kitasatospora sp. NPDC087314 TaxID=3364068 RepID=UPI00381CD4FE
MDHDRRGANGVDDEQTVPGVSNRIINSTVHGDVYQAASLTVHQHAVRTAAEWPHLVERIPPQAGCFQVRGESERLARALEPGENTVVVAPAAGVVVGLGGVGKTQLAAHYARTLWHGGELDVLVWITAATTTTEVVAGLAAAAAELLGDDTSDAERAARQFLAWLEPGPGRPSCRWLIVLDDVADPADLTGLWPPASPQGRTLVTSRRRDAAITMGRRIVPVGVFTPVDSQSYLTGALAADRQETDTELAALADDLGHLPLALSQAAAYLIDTGRIVSGPAGPRIFRGKSRCAVEQRGGETC